MQITIQRVTNGFVVHHEGDEDGVFLQTVVEEKDDEIDGVECFCSLLRLLDILIGPSTSRNSEKRVYIQTRPGDKRDDFSWCDKCDGEGYIKNEEKE